jgi:hypothetical protein
MKATVTEQEVMDVLKRHGVKVELGAQYSIRCQFAQVFNAVAEIVLQHNARPHAQIERTQKASKGDNDIRRGSECTEKRPSEVRSDALLAVTQDLVREIKAVLLSKGIRTRLCDTNIAWHARRVREALTPNSVIEPTSDNNK